MKDNVLPSEEKKIDINQDNVIFIKGKLYDPRHSDAVDSKYCDNDKKYVVGKEFKRLTKTDQEQAMKEVPFEIGNFVETDAEIIDVNPETQRGAYRPLGKVEVVDILKNTTGWTIRVRYKLCNNYKGNRWLHYSDLDVSRCKKANF